MLGFGLYAAFNGDAGMVTPELLRLPMGCAAVCAVEGRSTGLLMTYIQALLVAHYTIRHRR